MSSLRDRGNQAVLDLFVAIFVFTLLVLHDVRMPVAGRRVRARAERSGLASSCSSRGLGAFIYYIDHMAHAIRASTVIETIWQETVEALERLYPELLRTGAGSNRRSARPRAEQGRAEGAACRRHR